MGSGTRIGLLHVTPKPHLRVIRLLQSNEAILFGHKISHLKFEIHVVMHLSHRRLQMCCQNINLSDSNALMALKGDGRWHSHWFIARYAQTTPTGN